MKKDKLVIIGNGFDLAHGYKTKYSDFQASEPYKTSAFYTYYKDYFDSGIESFWNDFEKSLNCIIANYLDRYLFNPKKEGEYEDWMNGILFAVDSIKGYLMDYLYKETHGKNPDADKKYLKNISKYLTDEAQIINFNYTNTAERYKCRPFYVHGSLDENDVVLGYDFRDDSDLAGILPKKTWKEFQRTVLAIKRFINTKDIDIDLGLYYPVILQATTDKFSGKGYDYGSIYGKPCADLIDTFMKSYNEESDKGFCQELGCSNIKTIVIMGPSLESDDFLLERLFNRCNGARSIILFSFSGEEKDDLENKKSIIKKYSKIDPIIEYYS